jgi:hypothetical protein
LVISMRVFGMALGGDLVAIVLALPAGRRPAGTGR